MDSRDAFLALNLLPKIGPVRVRRLLDRFEKPQLILRAGIKDLNTVPGIGDEMAAAIRGWEDQVDISEEKRRMEERGIHTLTLEDEDYPPALRQIHDPPFLLYAKGKLRPSDAAAIGVVGSRRMTHYGREQTRRLSFQLAKAGFCIVSGLARGIDTAAHEAALAADGRTIAVLGSGIGNIYPPENEVLAERITEQGAILSEFPVLYVPDKQSFPLRNRIVSGLSQGLLVVEAPARSGSMITANQALEQGRSVFAVPGPIDRPTSEGCHRLIRAGAALVCEANDIIEDLGAELNSLPLDDSSNPNPGPVPVQPAPELAPEEARLLEELEGREATVDDLAEAVGEASGIVSARLLQLEMKRLVRQLPGKYFAKLI
ncbi:MAG: DNA-processing protein DprA [Verrucomicrobiota bacterium]